MLARPSLPSFDYVRAGTREEVVRLLEQRGDRARLLSGGTDLIVRMRDGALRPEVVVDVKHLPGMRDIVYEERSGLRVGAAVTMNQLATHPAVRANYPLLAMAAQSVATYQIRNRATIGGNLCNCSPAADTAPAFLVLDGSVVLYGSGGERVVAGHEFFLGPGRSARAAAELVLALEFPVPPPGNRGTYLKLGRNRGGDLALVSVAVFGFPSGDSESGYRFRIALGSVAPIPLRVPLAEQVLASQPPGEAAFSAAAEGAMQTSSPIDDVRASANYRRAMVRNLTQRGLAEVWAALQ